MGLALVAGVWMSWLREQKHVSALPDTPLPLGCAGVEMMSLNSQPLTICSIWRSGYRALKQEFWSWPSLATAVWRAGPAPPSLGSAVELALVVVLVEVGVI